MFEKKLWKLNNISKSRDILFGISTLWLVLFHSYSLNFTNIFGNNVFSNILNVVRKTGNYGVDIFLLLSGFGLYYSLKKNSNLKMFYKKRICRIIPSIIIVLAIYYALLGNISVKHYFEKVFLLDFYINKVNDYWYFSLIVVLYLIYPLIHKLIDKYDKYAAGFIILFILFINFFMMNFSPLLYKEFEIALTRLPIFIFGIFLGKRMYEDKEINRIWVFVALFILIISFILNYHNIFSNHFYIYRYLGNIVALCLTVVASYIFSKRDFGIVNRFLIWIGSYSMEIYLIYENFAKLVIDKFNFKSYIPFYFCIFIVTLLFSKLLKLVTNEISEKVLG